MKELDLQSRRCFLLGDGDTLLIQPTDERELELLSSEFNSIDASGFMLAAVPIRDWNTELSPWAAPPVFGREGFGGGAADTLRFITEELLPAIPHKDTMLGGYSLAGLFALWAAYQTDAFRAVAAVSPSVWFPGWISYAGGHRILADRVYLSLGDREEQTKNITMSAVGDNIRQIKELLSAQCECVLEWNPGNHFADADTRTAKGFSWLLKEKKLQ